MCEMSITLAVEALKAIIINYNYSFAYHVQVFEIMLIPHSRFYSRTMLKVNFERKAFPYFSLTVLGAK